MARSAFLRAPVSRSLAAVALLGSMLFAAPVTARSGKHHEQYDLDFTGSFDWDFPTLTLAFFGDETNPHLGLSEVDGLTTFAPSSAYCFDIVEDSVTITAADGSTIELENTGTDCLDFSTGVPRVVGEGLTEVVGGTGRFADITGSGTYEVAATMQESEPTRAGGTFVLSFSLTLNR